MIAESSNSQLIIHRIFADQTVLLPDHPVSHVLLPEDDSGDHYGVFVDGVVEVVAVVSVFDQALPQPTLDENMGFVPSLRFRKFACDPAYQGQGIGTRLLQHIFDDALSEIPTRVVWCDARVTAAGWYEQKEIGMTRFGETFFKSGVEYVRTEPGVMPQ